jgi:glycine dehydrogenase subunit 1
MDYIQHTEQDIAEMLEVVGADSLDNLFDHIPEDARFRGDLNLPAGLSEQEVLRRLNDLAARNTDASAGPCFLGAGSYNHFIPTVVEHLASRNEFYTAYTPYQAEASQGMLQAFYEYQSLICELTAMECSNASHYDAATGLVEAVLMAFTATGRETVAISRGVHPEYRKVLETYFQFLDGVEIVPIDLVDGVTGSPELNDSIGAVVFQAPNFLGNLEDGAGLTRAAHDAGALAIAVADPISLGLLQPPGAYDADIAVGDVQPFGVDMQFGGPSCGYIACKEKYVRNIPGRIVGETVDHDGRRGYVLTLQTREQHIRREKASSNICTNVGLMALRATIHMAALGRVGLKTVSELNLQKAHYLADRISEVDGYRLAFDRPFFREFTVTAPKAPADLNAALLERGILGGYDLTREYPELENGWLLTATELTTNSDIDELIDALKEIG